jgi:hypothetical protein
MLVDHLGLYQDYRAAAAGAALMITLGVASLVKARILSRLLGERINNWRWALIWATAPAVVIGFLATRFLPEWAELAIGIPAILGGYAVVIWKRGFGPEDRVLFKRNVVPAVSE